MRSSSLLTILAVPLFLASAIKAQEALQNQATSTSVPSLRPTFSLRDGDNLHIVLQKSLRITGLGQAVVGRVTEPVYHGEQELVAPGDIALGHITSLRNEGGKIHAARLLSGDLTMPRYANVTFDELVRPDGQHFKIQTTGCKGVDEVKMSSYQDRASKMSVRNQIKVQVHEAIHTPNKLQKLSKAVIMSLPYHPNFLDEGTMFNAAVIGPTEITAVTSTPVADLETRKSSVQYLHLRLLTSISSHNALRDQPIRAVVSVPFYNSKHELIYTAGTQLTGSVTNAKSASWLNRHGSLHFDFQPLISQQHMPVTYRSKVVGVEAGEAEALSVDIEGGLRSTSSRFNQIFALGSLVGPSKGLDDPSNEKTAIQRSADGYGGLGLLGSGAAQASASTAIGLGFYGAARTIYSSFIAKGSDVDLPINTALLLELQ